MPRQQTTDTHILPNFNRFADKIRKASLRENIQEPWTQDIRPEFPAVEHIYRTDPVGGKDLTNKIMLRNCSRRRIRVREDMLAGIRQKRIFLDDLPVSTGIDI